MDWEYEKRFGANLRLLREQCGLTQVQVSARLQVLGLDITRSALAKIEAGQRHVYADEISALKAILHCSYEELFP